MSTEIVGKDSPFRITSTDEKVVALLEQIEHESYHREAARQGMSATFWCSPATVRRVRDVLNQ